MAAAVEDAVLSGAVVIGDLGLSGTADGQFRLRIWPTGGGGLLELQLSGDDDGQVVWVRRAHEVSVAWTGRQQCVLGGSSSTAPGECKTLGFATPDEAQAFERAWKCAAGGWWTSSRFNLQRPAAGPPNHLPRDSHLACSGEDVVRNYFVYYSRLSNQANMLQDGVRTEEYGRAILGNASSDFKGRVVMDVGAGSGILSFFAARAGAARVFAVEASSAAAVAAQLAASNPDVGGVVKVLQKPVETVTVEEDLDGAKVDVLLSEPIGIFLFNERMIESFLYARDNFLKPGGKMYPDTCRLYMAPFSDPDLYSDFLSRASFWETENFHGLNLSSVAPAARLEQFAQPVVDHINPDFLCCRDNFCENFDLSTLDKAALKNLRFEFEFLLESPRIVHGIAGWFDIIFNGSEAKCGFSTAPWASSTHWYQIRFLFLRPLAVNEGDSIAGVLEMRGNEEQSYHLEVVARVAGTGVETRTAVIDLKDPDYRYYSNPGSCFVPNC